MGLPPLPLEDHQPQQNMIINICLKKKHVIAQTSNAGKWNAKGTTDFEFLMAVLFETLFTSKSSTRYPSLKQTAFWL